MSLTTTKQAVYERIINDGPTMALLGQPPYPDRLPKNATFSTTKVAVVIDGLSIRARGFKEDQAITLHLYSRSHDRAAQVVDELYRLFDSKFWLVLGVAAPHKALTIVDFETDQNDPDAEFIHKIVRLNVKFAGG